MILQSFAKHKNIIVKNLMKCAAKTKYFKSIFYIRLKNKQ